MNSRPIFWMSAALNLALAAGIFLSTRNRPAAAVEAQPIPAPAAAAPVLAANVEIPAARNRPASASVHWGQFVSDNLRVYRDNLLAVGCPKSTVHDIILAEINERFDQRRRGVLTEIQNKFWDFAIRGEAAIRNEWGQPLAALVEERQSLINSVFGKDYGIAEAELQTDRENLQRHLSWLPAEKRDRLFALEQLREQRLEELQRSFGGKVTVADHARMLELEQEFEDARKALFTPEELEEYRLRKSNGSLWAMNLAGFEATETEWRAVARLRAKFDEAHLEVATADLADDERLKRRDELQEQLTRDTRAALGAERFAQYEVANDGIFQEMHQITQRYGLPESTARRAYELQQTAAGQVEKVRANESLSPQSRQAALDAIRKETERTLSETLGPKVFATYKRYGGDWIKEME